MSQLPDDAWIEPGTEAAEPDFLVITAITSLWWPSVSEPEAGPATRALAASYERYADELAAIEALRSPRHKPG